MDAPAALPLCWQDLCSKCTGWKAGFGTKSLCVHPRPGLSQLCGHGYGVRSPLSSVASLVRSPSTDVFGMANLCLSWNRFFPFSQGGKLQGMVLSIGGQSCSWRRGGEGAAWHHAWMEPLLRVGSVAQPQLLLSTPRSPPCYCKSFTVRALPASAALYQVTCPRALLPDADLTLSCFFFFFFLSQENKTVLM